MESYLSNRFSRNYLKWSEEELSATWTRLGTYRGSSHCKLVWWYVQKTSVYDWTSDFLDLLSRSNHSKRSVSLLKLRSAVQIWIEKRRKCAGSRSIPHATKLKTQKMLFNFVLESCLYRESDWWNSWSATVMQSDVYFWCELLPVLSIKGRHVGTDKKRGK